MKRNVKAAVVACHSCRWWKPNEDDLSEGLCQMHMASSGGDLRTYFDQWCDEHQYNEARDARKGGGE